VYLSLSKRFELSTSHQIRVAAWPDERNESYFGRESQGQFGHGHNFVAYFVFHGPVVDDNGMMINVSIIKERIKRAIYPRYDHRYLNQDTPPFDRLIPTPENIASELLRESRQLFEGESAEPVVCHLEESPWSAATAYADGRVERHLQTDFSAARRTFSPHLTEQENNELFGIAAAPSGHGHSYKLHVTIQGEVDPEYGMIVPETRLREAVQRMSECYDHLNLMDLPEFEGKPMTTEMLAKYFHEKLQGDLPVSRVRLHENDWFFCEYNSEGKSAVGLTDWFHAAHRLHSEQLSEGENIEVYGKCNNPKGHGHLYKVESTVTGTIDERTGTMLPLMPARSDLHSVLDEWDYKHLNYETDDFKDKPTTGENIVQVLWKKLESKTGKKLFRVRLWETPNNRFTLRREV